MIFDHELPAPDALREAVSAAYRMHENSAVEHLHGPDHRRRPWSTPRRRRRPATGTPTTCSERPPGPPPTPPVSAPPAWSAWRTASTRWLDAINGTGYGLTLGIHSRIDETIARIQQRLRVGNTYVNRSQVGAVVGSQSFGGEGLSGTGPKAGGPRYLHRFTTERVLTVDTTARGGNASLLSLPDEG